MIEIGEYVKTKNGEIGIFDRYSSRKENSLYKSPFNCFIKVRNRKTSLQCCEDYIVKHSKQLIDLIEIRDILKYRIKGLKLNFTGIVHEKFDNRKGEYYKIINGHNLKEIEIEQILTHEQFKANCYKVGGRE